MFHAMITINTDYFLYNINKLVLTMVMAYVLFAVGSL